MGDMPLIDALLPEFDREMGLTRRVLERVPDRQFAWQPHATSMTVGRLAEHLAELAHWTVVTMNQPSIDRTTGRPAGYTPPATRTAVLDMFDSGVAGGRAALAGKADSELMAPWTLLAEGKELFTMPKATVLRTFILNHIVHHRGQMTVYLRMLGVPIPSLYGPSGDERG